MVFIRTKEDFICEHCGVEVKGNGYTNHCPKCLWAKHVDVEPGDRAEKCGGMMEPIGVEMIGGDFTVTHACTACGIVRRNKATATDDQCVILDIAKKSTI